MLRVIVAAAGSQAKWGGHLGVRSHFAPVRSRLGGEAREPLLGRTLRMLVERGVGDVMVTAPSDAGQAYADLADAYGVPCVPRGCARDEFVSTRDLWAPEGRTLILYGDVWFTEHALGAVLHPWPGPRFFGRQHGSVLTGSPWGEAFAASWDASDAGLLDCLLVEVRAAQDCGQADASAGWSLLRALQGTPLQHHVVVGPWWVEIDDATDDIDTPADYERHPATRSRGEPKEAA
jgi:hypothetical protein